MMGSYFLNKAMILIGSIGIINDDNVTDDMIVSIYFLVSSSLS